MCVCVSAWMYILYACVCIRVCEKYNICPRHYDSEFNGKWSSRSTDRSQHFLIFVSFFFFPLIGVCGSPLVWSCQWPSSQALSSPQLSHNDSLSAYGITKSHWEQGLDYRDGEELSWCPFCSNSLWQGWSWGLVYCPGGNTTDRIWSAQASSLGISSWTPLKLQHSNPNPNPLVNQLWCIDFLSPPTRLIIPHRLPAFLESLMPLKNWCSIHARCSKSRLKNSIRFCGIFSKLEKNFFIAYHSSSRPDSIFEIHQLWQSGFSRVYSNCCCSCLFEPEIIKIGQSSHKIGSNNIVNFQESMTIVNAYRKNVWKLIECATHTHTHTHIYIYIYIFIYI